MDTGGGLYRLPDSSGLLGHGGKGHKHKDHVLD
jgi:hypothetical protein